jgi:NitT/TauT family transport system permease protein
MAARWTSAIAFLLGWQLVTLVSTRVPSPVRVLEFPWLEVSGGSHGGVVRGEFIEHFLGTLGRYTIGLVIGFTAGLLIGVLIGSSSLARALASDTILVLLALPAIVWAFLTTMWFGIDVKAPIVTVALSAFPFVVVNVAQGVRSITPDLRRMTAAFGVERWKQFRYLTLGAISGYVFAGLRFAVIIGWNGVLLWEWFAGQNGVGFRTRYWYDANRYQGFVGWVVAFIVFIVLLDRFVFARLERRAFRWRDRATDVEIIEETTMGL